MRCFVPGRTLTWDFMLRDPNEVVYATLEDSSGQVRSFSFSANTSSFLLTASIQPGAQTVAVDGVPAVGWYKVGAEFVHIIDVTPTGTARLRSPVMYAHNVGDSLLGCTGTLSLALPGAAVGPSGIVICTSDYRSTSEQVVIWPAEFPEFQALDALPRLRGYAAARPEIRELGTEAVSTLRGLLFGDGLVLDGCGVPDRCTDYLRTWCALRAAQLGIDALGGDMDRNQQLETLQRQLQAEHRALIKQSIFPRTTDGAAARSGLRMVW